VSRCCRSDEGAIMPGAIYQLAFKMPPSGAT
jgi:hypothetical protein